MRRFVPAAQRVKFEKENDFRRDHSSMWPPRNTSASASGNRRVRRRQSDPPVRRYSGRSERVVKGDPETFVMVVGRWFEAVDDWCENAALTRSRHHIDGSLSLDGFRSGWMAANGSLGPITGSRV